MKRKVVACAVRACVRSGPGGVCGMRWRLGGREHAGGCFSRCGAGDAGEPFVCTFRCYGRIRLLWVPWRGR